MSDNPRLKSVYQFNEIRGQRTLHPLVTVLDQSLSRPIKAERMISELYIVFLKERLCGELSYGRNRYDYQEGTLVCIAPGQTFGLESGDQLIQPYGWALAFHPDLIAGTRLGKIIRQYHFFYYSVNEGLHLSVQEREIVVDSFRKIQFELNHAIDTHSRTILVSSIELFLNYCNRFYDRQFITRDFFHKDKLSRLEEILEDYLSSESLSQQGLPTVAYLASQFNLSANYFGDMVKKETGLSAKDYIIRKVIDVAKERVFHEDKTISEIAYELGFRYPQHFSRLFKDFVGQSPIQYRNRNSHPGKGMPQLKTN